MAMGSFDYFQLLSGTCLPIKPIAAFEILSENQPVTSTQNFARKFANDSDCDIRHNIIGRVTAVHA